MLLTRLVPTVFPPQPPAIRPQDFALSPTATATLLSWPRYYVTPVVHQWNKKVS